MEFDEHDPWNEESHRHPRAAELMQDEVFWECVHELAPFGSDEGADAYIEYRRWRAENPDSNLVECISWILGGRMAEYNMTLVQDELIGQSDDLADHLGYPDAFTLDTTVIATVLGQLVDEGRIDGEAKPFAKVAIARQSNSLILAKYRSESMMRDRHEILQKIQQVIDVA
jgi:uncharacterized protein YfeS